MKLLALLAFPVLVFVSGVVSAQGDGEERPRPFVPGFLLTESGLRDLPRHRRERARPHYCVRLWLHHELRVRLSGALCARRRTGGFHDRQDVRPGPSRSCERVAQLLRDPCSCLSLTPGEQLLRVAPGRSHCRVPRTGCCSAVSGRCARALRATILSTVDSRSVEFLNAMTGSVLLVTEVFALRPDEQGRKSGWMVSREHSRRRSKPHRAQAMGCVNRSEYSSVQGM